MCAERRDTKVCNTKDDYVHILLRLFEDFVRVKKLSMFFFDWGIILLLACSRAASVWKEVPCSSLYESNPL